MRFDDVIFGHTHNPGIVPINRRRARYIHTGNWLGQPYYVAINDSDVELTRDRRRATSSAVLKARSVHRLAVGSEDSAVAVLVAGHGLGVRAGKRPVRARR